MMLKMTPLRHCLYKAPSDQIKFENKERYFQLQVIYYEKVYPGQSILEVSQEKGHKEDQCGDSRRREGEGYRPSHLEHMTLPTADCLGHRRIKFYHLLQHEWT